MAVMEKTGYQSIYVGKTSIKVNTNANGNIAQEGEVVKGTKTVTFQSAATNTATENITIGKAFLEYFGGGSTDAESNKAILTWEVE